MAEDTLVMMSLSVMSSKVIEFLVLKSHDTLSDVMSNCLRLHFDFIVSFSEITFGEEVSRILQLPMPSSFRPIPATQESTKLWGESPKAKSFKVCTQYLQKSIKNAMKLFFWGTNQGQVCEPWARYHCQTERLYAHRSCLSVLSLQDREKITQSNLVTIYQ